ncbi:hypothetical protein NPIL_441691 [Nephila pilipes]|uniref:Uncharacterized protein n=1 Tax=Nephila pilipes TaxID=299642 RepID=A0A8X6T9R4_NEPPI|nr:hypothetical protein NPIL_441691 [Nephila pilipes]
MTLHPIHSNSNNSTSKNIPFHQSRKIFPSNGLFNETTFFFIFVPSFSEVYYPGFIDAEHGFPPFASLVNGFPNYEKRPGSKRSVSVLQERCPNSSH